MGCIQLSEDMAQSWRYKQIKMVLHIPQKELYFLNSYEILQLFDKEFGRRKINKSQKYKASWPRIAQS